MKKSVLLAILIAIVAVGWMLSGMFGDRVGLANANGQKEPVVSVAERQAQNGDAEKLTSVRVMNSSAKVRTREVVARGRTEAKRKVVLKSETSGRVVDVLVEKGARVKQGDVIVRIAMDDREAHLAEAQALVRQREIEYQAADKLRKKGYRAETQYAASAAQLDAAKAMVKQMQVDIGRTILRAPFNGLVDDRMVELGDYVKSGDDLALIIDEDPYLVIAQVSEQDVTQLSIGSEAFAILFDGQTVRGTVRYISATAQPDTRTFRVELEVPNKDRSLRDGVTAEIHFPTESLQAHYLTPAVLTLNEAGIIGVRTVDADDRVEFQEVSIVGSDANGVWLAGLPGSIDIIVVGQEFVRDGDKVRRGTMELKHDGLISKLPEQSIGGS